MKNGFTIVELLVVIAVLSIVGLIVLYIFTNSLRASNKAQILSSIKKNGQASLEVMDKTIRNADNVVCVSNDSPSTSIVVVKNGVYTRFRFINQSGISTNGSIQQDSPTPAALETTPTPFINRVCGSEDVLSSPKILTDTDPQTGASVQSGSFTRGKQAGFKDIITISFKVDNGIEAPQAVAGQIDPVDFSTAVGLR